MNPSAASRGQARVVVARSAAGTRLALEGPVVIDTVEDVRRQLGRARPAPPLTVELSGVTAFDTAGAWLVAGLGPEEEVTLQGASEPQGRLLDVVRRSMPDRQRSAPSGPRLAKRLETLGRGTVGGIGGLLDALGFLGLTLARTGRLALRPGRLRLTPLVAHVQDTGLSAIPIVSLMAFLIGVVLAFQGAAQLRQFGAEVFVVDLIAISILRELGVLLTAVIVAGRSGAAFTAAIGSMKMREEVDALRALGLDPIEVLVVPRVLALVIALPILGFVADMMGLLGGAVMSWIELGVSPGVFRTRLDEGVDVWNYAVGLIKAPVFALVIAVVGCHQGFAVEGNAESLGRRTSRSVVISIFTVIVIDAAFSVFFALVGV